MSFVEYFPCGMLPIARHRTPFKHKVVYVAGKPRTVKLTPKQDAYNDTFSFGTLSIISLMSIISQSIDILSIDFSFIVLQHGFVLS